jgi:hypothetical protein
MGTIFNSGFVAVLGRRYGLVLVVLATTLLAAFGAAGWRS